MRRLLFPLLLTALVAGSAPCVVSAAEENATLDTKLLQQSWSYDPAGTLRMTVANPTHGLLKVTMPAGVICETLDKSRVVTLREMAIEVPSGGTLDAEIPAAVLDQKSAAAAGKCTPTGEQSEKLEPLLRYLKTRPDVPRGTSQLVVLCLTEDINFASLEKFFQVQCKAGTKVELTPAEIVQAIDALGILRAITPDQPFALATDPDLKRRALRNPWCRAKAMQLYGLTVPELGPAQAPDLGELLHTKANDNCPVCRLRGSPPGGEGSL